MRNGSSLIFSSLVLLFLLMLTACSTRKQLPATSLPPKANTSSLLCLPSANRDIDYLSCTLKMGISINADNSSAKGKLRVKAKEGIQMSATAAGLMEVACLEFLPHAVRFIYKPDKLYAEEPYSGVSFLYETGTNYKILEAVLLNSIFSPDGTPLKKAIENMTIVDKGDFIEVKTSLKHPTVYKFYIEKTNGNLVRCEGDYANGGKVVCVYSDFEYFDGTMFPKSVELTFNGNGGVCATLSLKMSALKSKEFIFSSRRVSKSYERIGLKGIFESMENNPE